MMKKVFSFILSLLVISTSLWAAAPEIFFMEPNVGLDKGGIKVKIHGSNFTGLQAGGVVIGGTPAPIDSSTDKEITITLPPHVYGSALVQVTVNGETSTPNADNSDYFTYIGEKKLGLASGFTDPSSTFHALGIYKVSDLKLLNLVQTPETGQVFLAADVAITPDGSIACMFQEGQLLMAIDLTPPQPKVFAQVEISPPVTSSNYVAISPDGQTVYISLSQYVYAYKIPSPSDPAPQFKLEAAYQASDPSIEWQGVAVSQDGSTLYACGDKAVYAAQISPSGGNLVPIVSNLPGDSLRLQVTPDNQKLVVVGGGYTAIINVPTKQVIIVSDNKLPWAVAVAPNGQFAYITGDVISVNNGGKVTSGTIRKLDLSNLNFSQPTGQYESAFFVPPNVNILQASVIAMDSQITAVVNEIVLETGVIFPNVSTTSGHVTPNDSSDPLLFFGFLRGIAITPDQAPTARVVMELGPGGYESLFDASDSWSPTFSTLPSSSQPDNGISSYRWDFGDGTTLVTDHPIVKHTYAQPGTYNFSLIVENKSGTSIFQVTQGQTMVLNGGPSAQVNQSVEIFRVVAPVLTGIFPPGGMIRGGHQVTLTGQHLLTTQAVFFGDKPAQFTVNSDNEVVAIAPRTEMLGPVQVFVVTQGGKSNSLPHTYTPDTLSPTHFRGRQTKNQFAAQTERVNVLTWDPPSGEPAVTYVIFRDKNLEHVIAKIPAQNALVFEDHSRRDRPYTYYIVAINDKGEMSTPASVTVAPR